MIIAVDKVQRPFMIEALNKLGIERNFLSPLKRQIIPSVGFLLFLFLISHGLKELEVKFPNYF